jgi:hypothetical protein
LARQKTPLKEAVEKVSEGRMSEFGKAVEEGEKTVPES